MVQKTDLYIILQQDIYIYIYIYRCYSTGYIGNISAGGIASHNGVYEADGYIYDCYSTAKIEGTGYSGSIAPVQLYQGKGGYI